MFHVLHNTSEHILRSNGFPVKSGVAVRYEYSEESRGNGELAIKNHAKAGAQIYRTPSNSGANADGFP
jgi:hypothetical protein